MLATENLVLRQQINVLQRTAPRRLSFNCLDRLIFVGLYRLFPDVRDALVIVKPDTVIRWHRSGFRVLFLPFMPSARSGDEGRPRKVVPIGNYVRQYWWCRPPRSGIEVIRPVHSTERGKGACFFSDK